MLPISPASTQALSFVRGLHAQALAADLHQAAGFFRDFDHLQRFGNGVSHGLLAINVLAGLHGGDGDGRVPMVGGGDADGVDVFAVQHLAIVARGGGVRLNLLGAAEVAVVQVADDGNIGLHVEHGLHLLQAADTHPDHAYGDALVRRCDSPDGRRSQGQSGRRGAGHGASNKLTPGNSLIRHISPPLIVGT